MATSVTITITNNPGNTFNLVPATFTADITIGAQVINSVIFGKLDANTAQATLFAGVFPAGPTTLTLTNINFSNYSSLSPPIVASAVFVFNSTPQTTSDPLPLFLNAEGTFIGTSQPGSVVIACLHGSSLITTRNGLKRIDELRSGEEVLTGKNLDEYTPIKSMVHCPLAFQGVDHDALIFEKGSLGENEPSERLIIDPGHPMCTKKEYLEKGFEALRPAGQFYEEFVFDDNQKHLIFTKKWTDVFVQSEPSIRYDLLLDEPYNTYIANGMIVQSRGYKDHRYKNFV